MKILQRNEKGYYIFNLEGSVALENTNKLKSFVKPYLEDSELKGIIFNMDKVSSIDSSGIGYIVSIYKKLKTRNCKFALSSLNRQSREVFTLTKLDKILVIVEDDQSALNIMSK